MSVGPNGKPNAGVEEGGLVLGAGRSNYWHATAHVLFRMSLLSWPRYLQPVSHTAAHTSLEVLICCLRCYPIIALITLSQLTSRNSMLRMYRPVSLRWTASPSAEHRESQRGPAGAVGPATVRGAACSRSICPRALPTWLRRLRRHAKYCASHRRLSSAAAAAAACVRLRCALRHTGRTVDLRVLHQPG
jgi:hypothetical protein